MKKIIGFVVNLSIGAISLAQEIPQDTSWKKKYQETAEKINDLVHTKLEVKPDFSKSYLYGKAWLTLKPHFYATDSLRLDAKGMEIKTVALVKAGKKSPLKFTYDEWNLRIKLDKTYKSSEAYTIYIEYTAKPDEFQEKYGTNDFLGIKGLYFIDPLNEDPENLLKSGRRVKRNPTLHGFPQLTKPIKRRPRN